MAGHPYRLLLVLAESATEHADSAPLAGYAAASLMPAAPIEAEVEAIAVHPAWQRRGCGQMLLQRVRQWALDHSAVVLRLEVRASNAAAQALYAGQGFSRTGSRSAYYHDPMEDAVLMEWRPEAGTGFGLSAAVPASGIIEDAYGS